VSCQTDANDPTETSSANSNSGASHGDVALFLVVELSVVRFSVDFTGAFQHRYARAGGPYTSLSAIVDPSTLRDDDST
jgi:hypothetical protein